MGRWQVFPDRANFFFFYSFAAAGHSRLFSNTLCSYETSDFLRIVYRTGTSWWAIKEKKIHKIQNTNQISEVQKYMDRKSKNHCKTAYSLLRILLCLYVRLRAWEVLMTVPSPHNTPKTLLHTHISRTHCLAPYSIEMLVRCAIILICGHQDGPCATYPSFHWPYESVASCKHISTGIHFSTQQ